jgi:chemotaxis protein MotA
MLTTLYGLIVAACLAGPVAARLERLSEAERRWQVQVLDGLEALARAEEEAVSRWVDRRDRA